MVKYGYVVFPTRDGGNGYLTIAIQRPDKGDTSGAHVAAFALCEPLDLFKKREGCAKANGRLLQRSSNRKERFTSRITFVSNGNWHEVVQTAFETFIAVNGQCNKADPQKLPAWFWRSLNKKTFRFGLASESPYKGYVSAIDSVDSLRVLIETAKAEFNHRVKIRQKNLKKR
jgi:hypothetical protein